MNHLFDLITDVTQDGTLVEMKMEDYEKLTSNTQEVETTPTPKKAPHSKSNVINVGNTTITKGNPGSKTIPTILRQGGKQTHVVKLSQSSNASYKIDEDKKMLVDNFGTDTEDDDFDDDDYLSDSQQMIKEMKAEAAYQEKKLIDQKRQEADLGKSDFNLSSEYRNSFTKIIITIKFFKNANLNFF